MAGAYARLAGGMERCGSLLHHYFRARSLIVARQHDTTVCSLKPFSREYARTGSPWRDQPERFGEWRLIATRYDKTDSNYATNWSLVATVIAVR